MHGDFDQRDTDAARHELYGPYDMDRFRENIADLLKRYPDEADEWIANQAWRHTLNYDPKAYVQAVRQYIAEEEADDRIADQLLEHLTQPGNLAHPMSQEQEQRFFDGR